ncbi:DUF3862 domain-containing protein [Bombilactobacillus bombi]|nr:DUF3862 domain-containing protein [Bombilactobacillus bombi]
MPPQKPKKPFYKKWWFWLIAIILVFSIGGGLGNNSNKKSDKSNESNKTESVKTRSTNNSNSNSPEKEKNPKTNGPSLEDYKAIKLGENDGTTDSEIESKFGKPNTTSSQTIENVKADEKIWNKIQGGSLGGNFNIGFSNGKAISKGISGLKVTRNKKISLDDFNSIQNGQSESDIINKFGQPNGYSETSIANHNSKQLTYNSDIKGDLGANFILTFTDGKVSGKTQTSMK